jgi:hypothetical protein
VGFAAADGKFGGIVLALTLVGGQLYLGKLLKVLPSFCLVFNLLELFVYDGRIVNRVCSPHSIVK